MIPLIGLAIQAAPLIAKWFGGDKAEETTKAVTDIASSVFGTTDPQAIEKKIAEDKALYVQWQTRLAELHADQEQREHEERLAEFKDVISARDNYNNSKSITDKLAIVTVTAFFILNATVLYGCYELLTVGVPAIVKANMEFALTVATMIGTITGWVNSKADVVYNFFFGSSRSSSDKTEAMTASMNSLIKNAGKLKK